ncbi:MAG: hypothetical protein HYX68_23335 [Planctomycetes bacterium]|nr:hypothetical protein [Planctomycetota bacterium]
MKRTCEKLCRHVDVAVERCRAELATLPDNANGLPLAESALRLRDAVAAVRQAACLLEQARHEPSEPEGFPP